jgi:peptide/nickel transport system permease protein
MSSETDTREELLERVERQGGTGLHAGTVPEPSAAFDDDSFGFEGETRGQWATVVRRFVRSPRPMFGLVVFLGLLFTSIIYDWLHPTQYADVTTDFLQPPSANHIFGTNDIGQDMFARVMRGTLQDIQIALSVMVIAVVIGTIVGAIAGFYGGKIDMSLMRFVDLILVIPLLVILILLAHLIHSSNTSWVWLALIIGGLAWTYLARLVRADVLSLREREFVEASRALGSTDRALIRRHLIPNAIGPIIVNATLIIAAAVVVESTLSFLGFGIQPPAVSLGQLIAYGEADATTFWWMFIFPVVMLLVLILSIFFIGDGIQSAIDPRRSRSRA